MISYGFFNSAPGTTDRDYDASNFNNVVRGMFSDGRAPMFGDEQFFVSPTSISYQISVTPGLYFFKGLWFSSTENETINITSPGSSLALIIRYSASNRTLTFEVVEQSQIDTNTDAILAYFNKAGDGTITVTNQFEDVSEAGAGAGDLNTPAILEAVNWQANQYAIAASWVIAGTNEMDILPEVADDATGPQKTAYSAAVIMTDNQANGSVTLRAYGVVPQVDIPIVLKVYLYKPSPKLAILSTNPYQSLQNQINGLSGSIGELAGGLQETSGIVDGIVGGKS